MILGAFCVGLLVGLGVRVVSPEAAMTFLKWLYEGGEDAAYVTISIFVHNLGLNVAMLLILRLLPPCVLLFLLLNAVPVGMLLCAPGLPPLRSCIFVLAAITPHGFFELGALFLAAGLALELDHIHPLAPGKSKEVGLGLKLLIVLGWLLLSGPVASWAYLLVIGVWSRKTLHLRETWHMLLIIGVCDLVSAMIEVHNPFVSTLYNALGL